MTFFFFHLYFSPVRPLVQTAPCQTAPGPDGPLSGRYNIEIMFSTNKNSNKTTLEPPISDAYFYQKGPTVHVNIPSKNRSSH